MLNFEQKSYQDPILTPGNLQNILQNLPGKIRYEHADYEYNSDSDTLENEINDFFKYTEMIVQLKEYRRLYEKEFVLVTNNLPIDDKVHVALLLDALDHKDQEKRLQSAQHLVYFALGCFNSASEGEPKKERIDAMIRNSILLIECNAFGIVYQKLQQTCEQHHGVDSIDSFAETDLYLTLIYILLETQRQQHPSTPISKKFKQELASMNPNLAEFLFLLMAKLRDSLEKSFPVKKTILLLWKSLLFLSGGLTNIKASTEKAKQKLGLIGEKSAVIAKSTPQDLYQFQNESLEKYPGYTPNQFPYYPIPLPSLTLANPTTEATATDTSSDPLQLAAAMGYFNATQQIDLPYQKLFPPKTSATNTNKSILLANKKQQQQQIQQNASLVFLSGGGYSLTPTQVLPLPLTATTHKGRDSYLAAPFSIDEAGKVYVENTHLSLSEYQLVQHKSECITMWQNQVKQRQESQENQQLVEDQEQQTVERFYKKVAPEFQNIIIVLLKLLLTAIANNSSPLTAENDKVQADEEKDSVSLDSLENIDVVRNKEVYSKAISGILLVLLKWTKSSHILKFEYLSQLLVDSGCLLLILKIIGLQEITDLVRAKTDVPYFGVFDYNKDRSLVVPQKQDYHDHLSATQLYTNKRNMFWTINYLRILQMLTKGKSHRVMLLTQYKSSAILKRLLKVSHPVLELYILKLLKSQVPFLGRKWRSQNMKIISAIYLNCSTTLKDEWVSKLNTELDVEEGKLQEMNLRILVQIYIGRNYLPSVLPLHDELNNLNGCTPTGPGYSGYHLYDLADRNEPDHQIDLDPSFLQDHQSWLQTEVFDQQQEDKEQSADQTSKGSETPYPHQQLADHITDNNSIPVSYQQLSHEINKLYIEQLNAEFKIPSHLAISLPPSPTLPSSSSSSSLSAKKKERSESITKKITPLTRYTGDERNMTYLRSSYPPSKKATSIRQPEDGYCSSSNEEDYYREEDLMTRLLNVEDKLVEKWRSTEIVGDPRYHFKMFEAYTLEEEKNNHETR